MKGTVCAAALKSTWIWFVTSSESAVTLDLYGTCVIRAPVIDVKSSAQT